MIEANANIVSGCERVSCRVSVPSLRLGRCLLLLETKGRQLTIVSRCFGYSVAVLAHDTCDLMVVLENLGPCTRRGGSCACLGAVSRVVVSVLMPGRCSYTSSRVRLTGDLELYSGRRGGVLSARALTVLGMASQCPGWWHSTRDGHTGPEVAQEMCPASLTSRRHPGRAPSWWPDVF
jgi:hypothetical protein